MRFFTRTPHKDGNMNQWGDTIFFATLSEAATEDEFLKEHHYIAEVEMPDSDVARIMTACDMGNSVRNAYKAAKIIRVIDLNGAVS
jgi:hypothetical protein